MSPKLLLLAILALGADEPSLAARTPAPRPVREAVAPEPSVTPRDATARPATDAARPTAATRDAGPAPAAGEGGKPAGVATAENAAAGCTCDPAELQLLRGLRARLAQLEDRERALVEREVVLGQIEAELGGRLQSATREVESLETRAGTALTDQRTRSTREREEAEREPQALVSLHNTLLTLAPKKAAQILASTDPDTAARLLASLPTERSAAILGTMDSTAAAALVQRMARKPAPVEVATAPAPAATTASPKARRPREKTR